MGLQLCASQATPEVAGADSQRRFVLFNRPLRTYFLVIGGVLFLDRVGLNVKYLIAFNIIA